MDISLIETLRWEPQGGFARLDRHLARLGRSAAALGLKGSDGAEGALWDAVKATGTAPPFPLPCGEGAHLRQVPSTSPSPPLSDFPSRPLPNPSPEGGGTSALRVRLELFAHGRIEVTTAPSKPLAADTCWTVKVATTRLPSSDPLLRHKTSRRAVYAAARAEFSPSEADEVVLLNEHGEVCEGTITSVFLDDGTGIMKTPPLACGLLAGVLREELLETGRATEQRLQVDDLRRHPFFVGNSLRGLIPARLA